MPKKELSKSRVWERNRRERLNVSFNNLSILLPNYDPATTLSKVEILQKAANYIRELQQENRNLLSGSSDELASKQVQQLKQRIEELVKRIQQLVNILRDANISIPSHLAVESSRPRRWSNKFNQEDGRMLLEKAKKKKTEQKIAKMQIKKKKKINRVQMIRTNAAAPLKTASNNPLKVTTMKQIENTSNIPSVPVKKSTVHKKSKAKIKPGKPATKLFGDKLPTVAQLLGLTMNDFDTTPVSYVESAAVSANETSTVASSTLINTNVPLPPGFIVIQGNSGVQQTSLNSNSVMNHHRAQPCIVMPTNPQIITAKKATKTSTVSQQIPLVLSNSSSNNVGANKIKKSNPVAVTKSHLLTAPVMASGIQTCPPPTVLTNHSTRLTGLGPGTLILANGNIVPVLPPPQTVLTATPTQFIVNSNQLPPPTNRAPVIMMQQKKNGIPRTTSSNVAALVTTSCSKPQQRSFPVLAPKVSKRPGTSDTTVTTFANKVPIPALTSRHQPVRCHQIQAPAINTVIKSTGKAKSKGGNENVNPTNTDLPVSVSDKVQNTATKKTVTCKVKEKTTTILSANDNSKQRSPSNSNEKVSITDVTVDGSGTKEGGRVQEDTEIIGEVSEKVKDKDMESNGTRAFISDEATSNGERNCKQNEHSMMNNQETQTEKRNETEEARSAAVKRKNECEDVCNKKKQTQCGMENHESRNADIETNNSVTNILDNTLPRNMPALKSCNTGTYTIDVLCMTEPGKCHNIDRISEESKYKENSSMLMDAVCCETVTKIPEERIKECGQTEGDTVQLTTNETSEISEVCRLNIQAVSRDNSKPVSRSESQLIINDPSLINTCTASDIHQCEEASGRTDKSNRSTALDSVPRQRYDTQNAVNRSQLFQATEMNKLPQSSQSVMAVGVAYPRTDFQLTVAKPQQNNLIKASSNSFSLQNAENIQNESRETSPEKSTEQQNSSSWQKGKESVAANSDSMRCSSIPVCQASHTALPVSASILQQQHPEINTACAKDHDMCNESSARPSLTHQDKKTVADQTEPSQMPPLQSSNLYPTFTATAMATQCNENTFIPITSTSADIDTGSKTTDNETNVNSALNISLQNSEFSSDLFASLQVPSSGQHPESVSPTAAFLLAFPLVSSSKVTEMIVDPQEEVGSDGMQGASTLLQIGNIEPDASHNTSKHHHSAIVYEMVGTSEAIATDLTTVSSIGIMSDRDNRKITSGGCNEHDRQQQVSCSNQERKMNSNEEPKISGKCSTNMTLPLENFSKSSSDKQWPNTSKGEVLEPGNRLQPRTRSIGTQSNLFSDLELKSSEATCSQNSLSSTIKTCLAIDTSMYNNSPLNGEKGSTSTTCFQQEMETGHTGVSKNNTTQHLTLSCQSHSTLSKSGQQHQECHSSSGLFQPPLSTFEPVTHKNTSNEDGTKKLAISTSTFSTSISQPIAELCMKPQVSVTLQHSGTCANTNVTQTFLTNKETHHVCAELSRAQIPGSTATDHIANQNSFHKVHPSQMISKQGTVTEESTDSVGSISYKSLTSSSSIASSVDVIKHNFSNHAVMDSVPHSSHVDRSVPYNHVPSSVPPQSYSYNLFSNDYSPLPSQVTSTAVYTQASSSNDNNKTSAPFSFSVAHNSSNFSILSWTTLSPMSAPTNSNQYDNFNVPPHNTSTDMPQHTPTTVASLQKAVSQNTSDIHAVTMSIPAVSEMQRLVHTSNCQKQCKSETNIGKSMNDEIHKLTGSFQGLYSNEEQQSLGMSDRDTSSSHMQFHPADNENQVTVPHEAGASSESFKFPAPSSVDVKSQQSARTNHSSVRMKASQQHHRPPVNWMTTPDVRTSSSCSAICNVPNTVSAVNSETNSARMNKEFEFCSTSNHNLFMSNSSVAPPTFDGRGFAGNAAIYGNHVVPSHSNLYTSNRQSSHLPYHKEETRNLHHNATHQRLTDLPVPGQNYHNETYTLPWTPRKVPFTSATMMPPDVTGNNFVPSTLPTLVGDLALGANYPMSGNEDSTHNKPYVHSNFGEGEISKKNASVGTLEEQQQDMSGKHIQSRHTEKELGISVVSNKARNNGSNNRACTQDYPGTAHSENGSSGATAAVSGNFLSVSQLVDQVKSGAGSSRTQVNTTARRSNNGNRHVGGGNKNNSTQSRQHTTVSSSSKRNNTIQNCTERDSNKKQQATNRSFSVAEGTSAMPLTGDINRKVNDGDRNSHYSTENTTPLMPPISQSSAGFPVPVHDMGSQPSSSVANSHSHWSPSRGKPGRSSASYKAPVSSYSAEALIGLSSSSSTINNANTSHLSQESTTNKVMTLPPPMVSERFCHNQNYHPHPQSARPLQMSASFGNEAIIPGNYFPAVDLPPSHHQDGNGSSIQTSSHHDNFTQTHQNQQPYSNASFSYPAGPTNMSGQGPVTLYPPTNFVSNANSGHSNASIPPVSLPTGFLPDLTGSNNFPGIPSDSNNSLIFSSPIMKSISVNRNNGGRHNPSYLQSSTTASSHHHHQSVQHLSTRNDSLSGQAVETNRSGNTNITSNDGNGNRRLSGHAGGLQLHQQTNNLGGNGNSNCSLTKQRGNGSRRRIPDPIPSASSSTSGITGLVDLGYLPMPPGIGSPMLGADDSTFLSHHTSGTFLAPPGPQLYPTGPTPNAQGTLYPPAPRPPTQTTSHTNQHSGSHLPPFSSCAPEQQNASLSRASHHQQQQQANTSPNATNTSGNSLANFNLSTIFPEINDKQVPSVPSLAGFANATKSLAPASSALVPSSNSSHHHSALVPPGSGDTEYPHHVVRPPTTVPSNRLPPPPVPLHTNFNNLLNHPPSQVSRMQWP